jgi:hypothetical protein
MNLYYSFVGFNISLCLCLSNKPKTVNSVLQWAHDTKAIKLSMYSGLNTKIIKISIYSYLYTKTIKISIYFNCFPI